jgi:cytochrome c oxidase assembly protein subunit 15
VTSPALARLARLVVAAAGLVVFTGTVVTASGPHAGDDQAARLAFAVRDVARVHSVTVLVLVALTLVFVRAASAERAPEPVPRAARRLVVVLVAQAAVGYAQYFTGVPALLVGVHVGGALLVWVSAVRLVLATSAPVEPVDRPPAAAAAIAA